MARLLLSTESELDVTRAQLCPAVLVAAMCAAGSAAAQEPASDRETTGTALADLGSRVRGAFDRPLHPVVQTVASGGWLGAGVGYDYPLSGRWNVAAKGVMTVRRYWLAEATAAWEGERVDALAYGRTRSMNRLNFFGAGPDSRATDHSAFTLRDPSAGVLALVEIVPGVQAGGRFEALWPRVAAGRHPERPSIDEVFDEASAPGLARRARFGRYQTFIVLRAPASSGRAFNQGGLYRVSFDRFDDWQAGAFDFHRIEIEARHTFAVARPYHDLTLHGWLSSAQPREGRRVPFYLQHTLGGTSNIRSLADEPLGGDGTDATLRGFANHRFRDNHLLLLQAEYRWAVWGPVDATFFVDAGKAVSSRADLDLSRLESDYGFSISLVRASSTVARADFAFGGDQGSRIYFSLGGLLP